MNFQQRIWIKLMTVLASLRPLMLYLLTPALVLAIGRAIRRSEQTLEEFEAGSGNFYMALGISLVIYILYRSCKHRKVNFFNDIILSFDKQNWKKMIMMFVFGSCTAIGIAAFITLIPFPDFLVHDYSNSTQVVYRGTDILLVVICQVALAPFTEEVVFRGYMLNRLLPVFGEWISVIIVTLVFALCHLSGIWIIYAFLMGYLLSKITIHEDNLIYAIIMHSGFNFPSVINFFIIQNYNSNRFIYGSSLLIAMYGLTGTAIAVLLGWKYYQKENEIC